VDTPEALYKAPRSCYVASFIDAGTVVRGRNVRRGATVEVSHPDVDLQGTLPPYLNGAQSIAAVLPRNRIKVSLAQGSSDHRNAVPGTVERCVFTGSVFNIHVRVSERLAVRVALTIDEVAKFGEENLRPDSTVALHWRPEDIVFVEDSEAAGAPAPAHEVST
jgi:ABC-type Fe3+/spermidine/putrescine transport system ATPase subunit